MGRAAQMRREFDAAFATPSQGDAVALTHLLAVRVGGKPYALLLAEVAGLKANPHVSPVPSSLPELAGMAGIRGELVPVYSLAALLGHEQAAAKWLVLCGTESRLALAFDEFERHLVLTPDRIVAADPAGASTAHICAVAHTQEGSRPVIGVASVTAAIARRCSTTNVPGET
jgi:purine-binding chemotaxis protein CheW